jgi:phage shock protein PspC (stress-responsive transcriptional regulator)
MRWDDDRDLAKLFDVLLAACVLAVMEFNLYLLLATVFNG